MSRLLIWDLPTRLFHWLFAFAFVLAYILGEEDDWLGWHTYFGYLVGGLVLFRLVWGFAGGHFSRFSNFPPNPAGAWEYLKSLAAGTGSRHLGHNPAGALAIYALLFLGLATALSGLALLGADKGLGPLAGMVSPRWEDGFKEVHEFCANTMLAVVVLHIAGVIVGSLAHGENLASAMVTGYKEGQGGEVPHVKRATAVAVLVLAGVMVFTVLHDFSGGCGENPGACAKEAHHKNGHDGDHDDH